MNEQSAQNEDQAAAGVPRAAILRPLALASVAGAGALVVWLAAIMLAENIYSSLRPRDLMQSKEVVIREDGVPLFRVYGPSGYECLTLDGRSAPDSDLRVLLPAELRPKEERWPSGEMPEGPRVYGQHFDDGERIGWYLLYDPRQEGSGWLEGFDWRTRRRIGYIGRGGFRSDMPPAEDRFRLSGLPSVAYWAGPTAVAGSGIELLRGRILHLAADDEVISIDLRSRDIRSVLRSPGLVSISLFLGDDSHFAEPAERSATAWEPVLAARSHGRIVTVAGGEVRETFKLPDGLEDHWISLFLLSPTSAVLAAGDSVRSDNVELIYLSSSGEVTKRQTVAVNPPAPPESLAERADDALWLPIPAVWTLGMVAPLYGTRGTPIERLAEGIAQYGPALAVAGFISSLMAWYAWRRLAKFGASYRRTWTAFVLLFGLPGLCGLLFHRRWPVREPCPSCGAPAPRDRDACLACREPFPTPGRNGIEVFA